MSKYFSRSPLSSLQPINTDAAKRALASISNPNSNYNYHAVNFVIGSAVERHPEALFAKLELGKDEIWRASSLLQLLVKFDESADKTKLVIPICKEQDPQHFTGLYIEKNEAGKAKAYYIDPTGLGDVGHIDATVRQLMETSLSVGDVTVIKSAIQHSELLALEEETKAGEGEKVRVITNLHSGAFTASIFTDLLDGKAKIHNGNLQYQNALGWSDFPELDKEASDAQGRELRGKHHEMLRNVVGFQNVDIKPETKSKDGLSVATSSRDIAEHITGFLDEDDLRNLRIASRANSGRYPTVKSLAELREFAEARGYKDDLVQQPRSLDEEAAIRLYASIELNDPFVVGADSWHKQISDVLKITKFLNIETALDVNFLHAPLTVGDDYRKSFDLLLKHDVKDCKIVALNLRDIKASPEIFNQITDRQNNAGLHLIVDQRCVDLEKIHRAKLKNLIKWPNNGVKGLLFSNITDGNYPTEVLQNLGDENSELKELRLSGCIAPEITDIMMIPQDDPEFLEFREEDMHNRHFNCIAEGLQKKGNKIEKLSCDMTYDALSILSETLQHENCKVNALALNIKYMDRLTSEDLDELEEMRESLVKFFKDPKCKVSKIKITNDGNSPKSAKLLNQLQEDLNSAIAERFGIENPQFSSAAASSSSSFASAAAAMVDNINISGKRKEFDDENSSPKRPRVEGSSSVSSASAAALLGQSREQNH